MGCGASTAKAPAPAAAEAAMPATRPTGEPTPEAAAPTAAPADLEAIIAPHAAKIAKVFAALDADGDGSLDMEELRATVAGFNGVKYKDVDYDAFLKQYDAHSTPDGRIDLKEFGWYLADWAITFSDSDDPFRDVPAALEAMPTVLEDFLAEVKNAAGSPAAGAATTAEEEKEEEDQAAPPDDLDDLDDLADMEDAAEADAPMLAKAKSIFDALDADGMGSLSKEELKQGLLADADAKALLGDDPDATLAKMDLDGDGEITWMEYEIVVREMVSAESGSDP